MLVLMSLRGFCCGCYRCSSAKASAEDRKAYSQRAKVLNSSAADASMSCAGNDGKQAFLQAGVGMLGIGDSNFPIATDLVRKLSVARKFVKRGDQMWRHVCGRMIEDSRVPEQRRPRCKCTADFCATASAQKVAEHVFQLCSGLLTNILRTMRDKSRRQGTHMTGKERHPLLLVSAEKILGWLIVRPRFKPLTLHGWAVTIKNQPRGPRDQLFLAELAFETKEGKMLPKLQSFEEIIHDIAATMPQQECKIEYQLPDYKVLWNARLADLHVPGDFEWISMTRDHIPAEEADGDGAADEDGAEVDEDSAFDQAADLLSRMCGQGKGTWAALLLSCMTLACLRGQRSHGHLPC